VVKKVTVSRYVDRFGTLHDTFAEAERAEAYRDLMETLALYSAYGEMSIDDIPRWLDANAATVQRYLVRTPKLWGR
jgi:hypothetical protein